MLFFKETIIRLFLLFPLGLYSCCSTLNHSSLCTEQDLVVKIQFPDTFSGTVFADGFLGDPKCSSPNVDASEVNIVSLNLPFMNCNTKIGTVKGKVYPQAMNKVMVQFHPLVRSKQDCEIDITCDIYYHLPDGFFNSFLRRNMEISSKGETRLSLMTGADLFGEKAAEMLQVSIKLFLVLYYKDDGEYEDLHIRKCFAHADNVTDLTTSPVIVAETDSCTADSLDEFALIPDKNSSSIRGFAEFKTPQMFGGNSEVFITCAFDLCTSVCPFLCGKQRKNVWSFVRTHRIKLPDKDDKGHQRVTDLRASVKAWSERLVKIKNQRHAKKRTLDSKRRIARSMVETFLPDANDLSAPSDNTDKTYESGSSINSVKTTIIILERTEGPGELLEDPLNNRFENGNTEIFEDHSNLDQKEIYLPGVIKPVLVDTQTQLNLDNDQVVNNDELESTGTYCLNSTCSMNVANISDSDIFGIDNQTLENVLSNFDMQKDNSSGVQSGTSLAEYPTNTDCVPRLKFVSVTASLSVLCVCFFLICIGVVLYTRKEKKRYSSHSSYLYNDF